MRVRVSERDDLEIERVCVCVWLFCMVFANMGLLGLSETVFLGLLGNLANVGTCWGR